MFQRRYPRIVMVIIVLLILSVMPAAAHETPSDQVSPGAQVDPKRILAPDGFLRFQAEQYADTFSVTVAEAERRLKLQPYIK